MPASKKKITLFPFPVYFEKKENYNEINKKKNNNIHKIVSIINMDILEQ